jgi:acyl-CoA reductase-like NAD-dependent aldehyde dehydrogenase
LTNYSERRKARRSAFEDEIFGPVAAISTFTDDDEAVELANRTDYGFSAVGIEPGEGRLEAELRTGICTSTIRPS